MSEMYRTSFSVDPGKMVDVTRFLTTIKSYNVDWEAVAGERFRVEFMHPEAALPSVVRFITTEIRAYDVAWPVPAVELVGGHSSGWIEAIDFGNKKEITTADLRAKLVEAGRSPNSTGYLSLELRKARRIKYIGGPTTGRYEVIAKAKAKAKKKVKKRKAARKSNVNGE